MLATASNGDLDLQYSSTQLDSNRTNRLSTLMKAVNAGNLTELGAPTPLAAAGWL